MSAKSKKKKITVKHADETEKTAKPKAASSELSGDALQAKIAETAAAAEKAQTRKAPSKIIVKHADDEAKSAPTEKAEQEVPEAKPKDTETPAETATVAAAAVTGAATESDKEESTPEKDSEEATEKPIPPDIIPETPAEESEKASTPDSEEVVVDIPHDEEEAADTEEPDKTEETAAPPEEAESTNETEAADPGTSPVVEGAEVPEEPVDETTVVPAVGSTDESETEEDATESTEPEADETTETTGTDADSDTASTQGSETPKVTEEVPTAKIEATDETAEETIETPTDDSVDKMLTIEEAESAVKANELEDDSTAEAVEDIVNKESDTVLEAEDAALTKAFSPEKPKFSDKIKKFFRAWWENPISKWATILLIPLTLIALAVLPVTRYFFLNLFGVHASTSVTVLDESTQQPLKNVQLKVAGQTVATDADGAAKLYNLPLGKTEIVIEKPGFETYNKQLTLGWGSNPLGDVSLKPTGTQFTFIIKDWLSSKPISKAEATSGSASAISDDNGKVVITLDKVTDEDVEITITADSYRVEKQTVKPGDTTEHPLTMVPARKHVFISNRSGKYDVYKIDVDGKNEEKMVSGTGHERDDMVLVPNQTGDTVALVSTRDNQRNGDGFLLSGLYLIDVKKGELTRLNLSERVQVVDWVGDQLVYVTIVQGTSAGNAKRTRLVSYNVKTESSTELASANYFNDVLVAKGVVYYAPSSAAMPADQAKLFKINADGTNKQTILDKEAWNLFRTDYDKLNISVQQDWYEYKLGDATAKKVSGPPAQLKTLVYRDNPAGETTLRVDERDGKGVLLLLKVADNKETTIQTKAGLKNPIYWLNSKYVVYRIADGQQTADYVMNVDGGDAKKIKDVTNTGGVDAWYYY